MADEKSDGVPARQESAGTPSPFRAGEPDVEAALEALEFPAALHLVAGHAVGPLGALAVRQRRPSVDVDWIRTDLGRLGEARDLLARGEGLDPVPVPPIADALARLRIAGSVLDAADLVALRSTIAAARHIAADLHRIEAAAPSVAGLAVPVPDRRIEQRLDRSLGPDGELLDGASPALAAARREVIAARERLVRKLETILRGLDAQAAPSGASVTMREGRYVIPVRRDSRARPAGIVHDESASAGTLFVEPTAAIELGNALREAMAAESRETLRVLRELTDLVRPHHGVIEAAHAMGVSVDDLSARARYAHAIDGTVPEVDPAGGLVLTGARHPLLLARSPATVPFDLELGPAERTLLVSGPNAGGKTVLLKTIGLATALVQAGIVPPIGPGSRCPVVTRLFTDIGDHQSIAADLSTFSAHVVTLRQTLDAADTASLVLLDELGSGTDPSEGAALAWAVLESLTRRGVLTIATTHLGALKTLAEEEPGVVNGSLEFDTATLSPTYRFRKGTPGRSYGLAIARRLGLDPSLVARAEDRVPAQERALDSLLATVEARARDLRVREAEAALGLETVERKETDLAAAKTEVEARTRRLRQRERDAERAAREQARAYLLAARKTIEDAIRRAETAGVDAPAEARRLVEDAIRDTAISGDDADAADGAETDHVLAAGSKVRLAGGAVGRVEEIRGDGRLAVRAGTVRMVVLRSNVLEVLSEDQTDSRSDGRRDARTVDREGSASLEIDLRGMRADEAESTTIAALDAAVVADQPFLRIIHGRGTGAVRERVHQVVKADRRVARFALAPANQGGAGVTVVEFAS